MKILSTIVDVRVFVQNARANGQSVGFVPTMGSLHEGHLSLVRASKKSADITVVSIFVNPTQFGPNEDFEKYQRDLQHDSALCETEGVDVIFAPTVGEMYQSGRSVMVNESSLSSNLCGRTRNGHFSGVLTVVAKLFNIVQPDTVFLGQKDAQQVRVIQQMISDLDYDIEMIVVPTVRDNDGLALSSRNANLTNKQRTWAPVIYESLQKAKLLYTEGTTDVLVLRDVMASMLVGDGVTVDYIEFVSWVTLEFVTEVGADTLLAVAVKVGDTRLIDNLFLTRTSTD